MNKLLQTGWLLAGLVMALSAQAQEWSFGPKANFGLSSTRTQGQQVQINSVVVTTTDYGDAVGTSLGAFARYDWSRWYAQAEVTWGRYTMTSIFVSGGAGGSALYSDARRTDARLIAGYKPLPWLRLHVGLAGAKNKWGTDDYANAIRIAERQIEQFPAEREYYLKQIEQYRISDAVQNSYKRTVLEGQAGVGVDVGGLMIDLTYAKGLSPVLETVSFQGQSYPLRQNHSYWSLALGYRLLPLKRHLLAPRKNRAYERIKQDIPFYRNEFHLVGGLLGEDIGSQFIYENRYTRYVNRRLGLSAGLNFTRKFMGHSDTYGQARSSDAISLLAGIRFLPLYSRRHTIGLTTGPMLTYIDDLYATGGGQFVGSQYVSYLNLTQNSVEQKLQTGWHSSVDYQFSVTDRLIAGPWLRVLGQSFIIPDYATFGIQAGYRF